MTKEEDASDYQLLADLIIEQLNPPDEDMAEVSILMDAVSNITAYVDSLPCTCSKNIDCIMDACGRCKALGRVIDIVVDR